MIHRNVERNIGSQPAAPYTEAAAPSFGKIRRTYETTSHKPGRKRKQKSRINRKFRLYLITVFVGVAFFFLFAAAKLIYSRVTEGQKTFVFVEEGELKEEAVSIPHPDMDTCIELVKLVHAAKSADELRGFAVLRRLNPEQAFELLSQWKNEAGEIEDVVWKGSVEINGLSMEMLTVRYRTGKKTIAYVRIEDRNDWGVDVESLLQYCTEPMEKILSKEDVTAVVRGLVSSDEYYNGEFADSKEWKSVAVLFPGDFEKIQGYVKNDSASYRALEDLLRERKAASVVLEIYRHASMLPKQYEIKAVIAKGWVESDVIFSDQFRRALPEAKQ